MTFLKITFKSEIGTLLEKGQQLKEWSEIKMQDLQNIFTTKNIIIYFILINIIGFLIMYIDKQKAKKGKWRIPEKTLFIITALGGGIGTIAGMYTFRHKTQKVAFVVGFPVITILEIICIIYFKFMS